MVALAREFFAMTLLHEVQLPWALFDVEGALVIHVSTLELYTECLAIKLVVR